MTILPATALHLDGWAALRAALWPDDPVAAHRTEAAAMLDDSGKAAFLAYDGTTAIGLVEVALRHDYVNGCDTSPVAFVEGLFVAPAHRRRGVAGRLLGTAIRWGAGHGCREIASDAEIDNAASIALHTRLGFVETERVVYFRRTI